MKSSANISKSCLGGLLAAILGLVSISAAHADDYGFVGGTAILPGYGGHPTVSSEVPPANPAYSESLSGAYIASDLEDSEEPFDPTQGLFATSLPGPGDSLSIGGVPAGYLTPTEGPTDNSQPNDPVYGYYNTYGFAGYTANGFQVTGVGGTIATFGVSGPGTLTLGGLTVTGTASISSVGGIPLLAYDPTITYSQGSYTFTGFAGSAQNINGGTLSASFLTLAAGTNLSPYSGFGATDAVADPVADAGSLTISGATLSGNVTQILGVAPGIPSTQAYNAQPVTLTNATLNASTELEIIGIDPVLYPVATGTTTLAATGSTITAGTVVIATGATGYGSGSADVPALLTLSGGSTLNATDTGYQPPSMVIGDTGDGTLLVSGASTLNSQQAVIGNAAGSTGVVIIDASTWNNASFLSVGSSGNGSLVVQNGARVISGDILYVGLYGDSVGILNITGGATVTTNTSGIDGTSSTLLGTDADSTGYLTIDGAGSQLESKGDMSIGYSGDGYATITNGGALIVDSTIVRVGRNEGSTGILIVSGAQSSVTASNATLYIGYGGTGTVDVDGGATLSAQGIILGGQATGVGVLDVDGGGSTLNVTGDTFQIALAGGGQFELTGGATSDPPDVVLGVDPDAIGLADIDGAGTVWTAGDLTVGGGGDGSLTVSNNATVASQTAIVGRDGGSTGTVEITDAGSIWHTYQDMTIGQSGAGDVTVEAGGTLRVDGDLTLGQNENSEGTLTIDGASTTFNYGGGDVTIGSSGAGTMTVQNGAFVDLSGNDITLGDDESGVGTLTVTDPDSVLNTGDLTVGGGGAGTLDVMNGGQLNTGSTTIGDMEGASGTATVTDAGSTWTASDLTVGGGGDGTLNIENGGVVTVNASEMVIGDEEGGNGIVTLSGPGSQLNLNGELKIGENGTGVFAVQGGASFTVSMVTIGDQGGSTGTLNVDGAGTFMEVQHDFNIGENGSGTLNVTNGANLLSDGDATLADMTGATAAGKVDAGSSWNIGGALSVGHQGIATFTISAGSTVSADNVTLGEIFGAGGTVTVTGMDANGPSTLQYNDALKVGDGGNGELDVYNGGQVTPSGTGSGAASVAVQPGSVGNVTVSGASSQLVANTLGVGGSTTGAGGTGNLTVSTGGAVQVNQELQLWTNGTIDVHGGGSVTVGSGAAAAINTVQVNPGGTLGGGGAIIGDVVDAGGTVAPGDPATLNVTGDYVQTGGILALQIAGTGLGQFDRIIASGDMTITDAIIDLEFIDGFAPQEGDTFDFLSSPGNITVSDVSFVVTGLAPGYEYDTMDDPQTGQFEMVALNNADAVPEPSTWAMLLGGFGLLAFWHVRTRRAVV